MYAMASTPYPLAHRHAARRPRSPWPRRLARSGLMAAAVLGLSLGLARAAMGGTEASYETLTIQPGDTLWAIASDRYPGTDVREKVYEIQQLNHLGTAPLYVGENLKVPSR